MRTFALLFAAVALASALELAQFQAASGNSGKRDIESSTYIRVCHLGASSTVINVKTNLMSNATTGFSFGSCTTLQGYDTTYTNVSLVVSDANAGTTLASYAIGAFSIQATQNLFVVYLQGSTWVITAPIGIGLIPVGYTRVLLLNAAGDDLVVDFYSSPAGDNTWTLLYGPTLQGGVSFLDVPATNQGANDIQVRDHSTGNVYTQKREFNNDNTQLADTEVLVAFVGATSSPVGYQLFSNPDVSPAATVVVSWAVIVMALFALLI